MDCLSWSTPKAIPTMITAEGRRAVIGFLHGLLRGAQPTRSHLRKCHKYACSVYLAEIIIRAVTNG